MANRALDEFHEFSDAVAAFAKVSGGSAGLDVLLESIRATKSPQRREWLRSKIADADDATINWVLCAIQLASFLASRCEVVDGFVLLRSLDELS